MTDKDLKSFKTHDADYQTTFNLENSKKRIAEYDAIDVYTKNGFSQAVEKALEFSNTHIDIGSGVGWLLLKTAQKFQRVIGIEPSESAIATARKITEKFSNIEYIQKDMIDGIQALSIDTPVFLTTGVVLSHIKDYYVRAFLHLLNSLPLNSVLYFHEPYGANIQQNLWHVRSKEWWANNLDQWDLEFMALAGPYEYGIYGRKVGKANRLNKYEMTIGQKRHWIINGLVNKIRRIGRGLKKQR